MFNFSALKQDAEKLIEVFASDLATIRTGRAKPSLVENIEVQAYGSMMKMLEVASITAPDSASIVIKPWDKSVLKDIEKAISISDLHIPPVNDGEQIRLNIPPLTGERRQELIKLVAQKKHAALDMLRDIRTKYKKMVDNQKGQAGISEDDIKRDLEALQKHTEEFTTKLEDRAQVKEKELSEL